MNWITSIPWEARSRLYRRRILQVNIRWALGEIYKSYILLHRSDLDILANFQFVFLEFYGGQSTIDIRRLQQYWCSLLGCRYFQRSQLQAQPRSTLGLCTPCMFSVTSLGFQLFEHLLTQNDLIVAEFSRVFKIFMKSFVQIRFFKNPGSSLKLKIWHLQKENSLLFFARFRKFQLDDSVTVSVDLDL